MHPEQTSLSGPPAAAVLPAADAALLLRIRRGDAEAGHRLVRDYYPGVYRYLLCLTGRREMAEDLTQETFLQAWRRLDTFEGRAPLRAWLHRIAHREFLQALRRQHPEASVEEVGELAASPAIDMADAVELRALIGRLPLDEQEVLVLHYLEGYSYEEIAGIVGAPVGRVKHRLASGRTRLRAELDEGDLVYLNQAPFAAARRWAWLPLLEMTALEARLHPFGSGHDKGDLRAMASQPNTNGDARLTAAGPAPATGAADPRETAVIDPRLTRKVTLAFKATALSDLCDRLRADTGIHLAAGRSVADEKVTLFCRDTPLREVMRQLSRPFGYTWARSGKEGEYRYELMQDLRSQLLEEELRNRDRNTGFIALEREIERYRPYLDLSPDEAQARAATAPPEEKRLLEKLGRSGWGAVQIYFRLTPRQLAALRAGEPLHFTQEPKPGELALPPEIARGVLQSLRDVYFSKLPDGFGIGTGVTEPSVDDLRPTQVPEARATLYLSMREMEPGRIALIYSAGAFSYSDLPRNSGGSTTEGDGALAIGTNPVAERPDNRAANARLAGDAALRRRVSFQTEGHCQLLADGTAGGQSSTAPGKRATSADALEALHRATGVPVVSDFYTRLYSPASLSVTDQPLFEALNRLADSMHLRWTKDGEWLQFRSSSFYDDRLKEVPSRLLVRWAESRKKHGALTLDDMVEIAALADAQLDATGMAEGARDCWGLVEWALGRHPRLRPHLRFLGELTPVQRREAASPTGLEFTKLSLQQQQRYIALALRFDDKPLQSLEELEGATMRVEYTQPGSFEWLPPGANWHRWVVPVVPGPEGRRALKPPLLGRTRDETLAAARRLDPRLLEAILRGIQHDPEGHRVRSVIQTVQAVPDAGEIIPTEQNLRVVYVPGLSNRRNISIVDLRADYHNGTW